VEQHFSLEPFPLGGRICSERPGAVKGAPLLGAAKRTLDGEDRSATISQEGKAPTRPVPMAATGPPLTVVFARRFFAASAGSFFGSFPLGFLVSGAQTMHPFVVLARDRVSSSDSPARARRAAQSLFRSLMTNAVAGPTRQLSLALQKLAVG